MDFESAGELDGVPVRVPRNETYRTCATCGGDCEPDTGLSANSTGVRIAWVCHEHGVHSIVDPFSDLR